MRVAQEPRWTVGPPTPAAVGTPEAREAQEQPPDGALPRWTIADQPGEADVSWATLTGQDMYSTANAFDTTFFATARAQDEEAQAPGARMGDRWTRKDATGVVVYNDPDKGLKFGDVFLDGVKQGNLREGYAGMDKTQGEEMLARMVLPREVWAKAYESQALNEEAPGWGERLTRARSVSEELDAVAKKNTEDYTKGLSASAFQADVLERAQDLQQSGLAQTANVAAGAGGGALVGAGIGSVIPGVGTAIGAVVGGIAGALGAWWNQDEQFTKVATAMEQYELAKSSDAEWVGAGDLVAGWVNVAASNLSPLRNVTRGLYDATGEGGYGDGISRYNTTDAPFWLDVVDTAALVADGIGTFGTKAAIKAYTATMAATATSQTATVGLGVAAGNIGFNPYSGRYEDLGVGGMAARGASAGIDFAQTAVGRGLGKRLSPGGMADAQGGFKIVTNADGTRQATRLGFSALIPSEAATGLSARMLARRSLRNRGEAMTRTNLQIETARHIDTLTTGRKGIATAMVNAFGEGAEEVTQAVLDALSVGETVTVKELFDAARQGAAMGAGMGVAVHRSSLTRGQQWRAAADAVRALRKMEPLTDAQWEAMSDSERALEASAGGPQGKAFLDMVANDLTELGDRELVANIPEAQRAWEAAQSYAEEQARNSQPLAEPSRLSLRNNFDFGPQDVAVSLTAAMRDIAARGAMFSRVAAGEAIRRNGGDLVEITGEDRAYAERLVAADRRLLERMEQVQAQIDAGGDVAELVGQLNAEMRTWWATAEGSSDEAFGMRRAVSVLSSRYPLNSAGSFQVLRLQISPELTLKGVHNAALVAEGIQPMIGGDFDGDMTNNMLRLVLPDESYNAMRRGDNQLTTEGSMITMQPFVAKHALKLYDAAHAEPGSKAREHAKAARRDLSRRLNEILAASPMDARDRERVVRSFVTKAANRRIKEAYDELFTELPTRYENAMTQLAIELDASPWLLLNRAIEDSLREFSTKLAMTDFEAVSRTGAIELPKVRKSVLAYRPAPTRAATEMVTGAIETGSWNMFRLQTILKYNALREPTQLTEEETSSAIHALVERFTAKNDGLVRSGDDALFEGTLIQSRVQAWMRELARESQADLGAHTVEEALVLLATATVPDVDIATQSLRSGRQVTLVQAVLAEVVDRAEREYADVLRDNEALQMRLSSLRQLTRPERVDGAKHFAAGGRAFVEMYATSQITDLVGDAASNLLGYTVKGLRDRLISLRGDVRQQFVAALKAHPHYTNDEGPGAKFTPYRALVDAVVEAANMELHETADGLAGGTRARADAAASENYAQLHKSLRDLARKHNAAFTDAKAVREFLAERPDLGVQVLRIMETRGVRAGVRRFSRDGEVVGISFPQWIYDVLAEKETARAEMMLLRNTLIYGKAALTLHSEDGKLDVDKVSDRLLRLELDLDYRANDPNNPRAVYDRAALDDYHRALHESQSVKSFLQKLNTDYRFRAEGEAPYMAWDRDRSTVAADRFGRGVSDVAEGTEMREALRDAAAAAARELQIVTHTQDYLRTNAALLDKIRASRDNGLDPEPWERFKRWFEVARELPNLTGASIFIEQAAHVNEILGSMGVKGQAPTNVDALGRANAAQLPTFDSALGRSVASATSGSAMSVLSDMTQLARSQRTFVMNDGTVIDWSGVTASQLLDMLGDPNLAGTAARMVGLTQWDFNSELGISTLTSALDEGVAGFAMDPAEALFDQVDDTGRLTGSQKSKFRRLSILEGKATAGPGAAPVLPVHLALQMNLRESAVTHVINPDTGEHQRMAAALMEDIASTLQYVASVENLHVNEGDELTTVVDEVTGERIPLLNLVLRRAGRRARAESGNLISRMVSGLEGEARDTALEVIRAWHARYTKKAFESENTLGKLAALKLKDAIERVDDFTTPVELYVEHFRNFDDPLIQEQLLTLLQSWGDIENTVPWARPAIQRALHENTPEVLRHIQRRDEDGNAMPAEKILLPDLTLDEWHVLARAAIAMTMHTSFGVATTSNVQIAEFPSLTNEAELAAQIGYWDPSGVSLVMDMLVPNVMNDPWARPAPLLQAQIELQRELAPQLPKVSAERASQEVYKLFAPVITDSNGNRTGVVGPWHALLPALYHAGVGAVMSAAAPVGISMAGINPQRMRMFGATTAADWSARPSDDELSSVSLGVADLVNAAETDELLHHVTDVELAVPGATPQSREMSLAQLEGRVAREVMLTLPDGTQVSMLGHPRFAPGLLLPESTGVAPGEAGVLSMQTLAESAATLLDDMGVPASARGEATLSVKFFHPMTKTLSATREQDVQYSHNAWFDGLAGRTAAARSQPSLIGSLYYSLDGQIPQGYDAALGAIKKLTSALQQATLMPEKVRRALLAEGLTDMAGMVDSMTRFIMQQPVDGKPLSTTLYSAVRKFIELLYVVRYVDENGVARVLSAEEVVARQLRGETFDPGMHAEVVGLPIEHVLTLMGEANIATPYSSKYGMVDYHIDLSRAQSYTRFPDNAWSEGMFDGFVRTATDSEGNVTGWATMDLLDVPMLRGQALPRSSSGYWAAQRDTDGRGEMPFRKIQERQLAKRQAHPQANTKWAAQREDMRKLMLNLRAESLVGQTMHAVQMRIDGAYKAAAEYQAADRSTAMASHDYTTGWIYIHSGSSIGTANGALVTAEEITEHAAPGDVVHILAAAFQPARHVELSEVFPQAREVLDAITATGAEIHLPHQPESQSLVEMMRKYLLEHGYQAKEDSPGYFVPVVTERSSQHARAYRSQLDVVKYVTNRNRALIELADEGDANENSIGSVNGGLGVMENFYVRDVIATARFADYSPSLPREKQLELIRLLRRTLSRPEGVEYLRSVSGVGKNPELRKSLQDALEDLNARMDAVERDPASSLMPTPGSTFGTGDIIPLASFDADGNLVGVHLYRHGHETVTERELRGAISPENLALGTDGVRLTIDKAQPDPTLTTHYGVVAEINPLGPAGFVTRMRVKLDDLGSKVFELGTGMKWTTTPSSRPVPTTNVFGGRPVLGAGDIASPDAKNSDGEWLNTPSRIIAAVGFDVMPYVVRALTNVEYTAENAAEYEAALSQVTALLRRFARENGAVTTAEELVTRKTLGFESVLVSKLQERLAELHGEEINLLDDSTSDRLADVTMLRLVLSTLSTGARLEETMGAPGFIGTDTIIESHQMPPVFTTLLEQLPESHPAKAAYVAQINARMEETRDERGDGYYLNPSGHTWTKQVTTDEGMIQAEVTLAYPQVRNADDNNALSEMAFQRRGRGTVSPTTSAMAHVTWGADAILDETKLRSLNLEDNPALHGPLETRIKHTFNLGAGATPVVARMTDDLPMHAAERHHIETRAVPARQALAVSIDDSGWYSDVPKAKAAALRREFESTFNRVREKAHLKESESIYLVEMIRAAVVRPAGLMRDEGEFLTRREAMAALKLIESNLNEGAWPLRGASANAISRDALRAMWKDGNGYALRTSRDTRRFVTSWSDWLEVMLSEVYTSDPTTVRYLATTNIIDGVLYEYRKDIKGLKASSSKLVQSILDLVQTDNDVIVSNPELRARLNAPGVQNGVMVYDPNGYSTTDTMMDELPQEARALVEERMTAWERGQGLGRRGRQSARAEARRSVNVSNDLARTNVFMRFAQLGYVAKTLLNVGLHVSSYLELAQRAGQESVVSFLSGQGLAGQQFTAEQRQMWKDVRDRLSENPEFYSMIYENTNWDPNGRAETRLEARVQRSVNFLTAMYNDPTWGTRATGMANAFMEAAWDAVLKSGTFVSVEQFLTTLSTNPSALASINADAVQHGYARVEYRRNLQDNLFERARRKMVEGGIHRFGALGSTLGVILFRFPTMFFRFRSNTLINLLGLQAPHAILTTLMSDRSKRPGGLRDRVTGQDQGMDPTITDQARVEDSIDLTRAIIRSGVSHTQLLLLGMALSGAGFGGGDEEEQRFLSRLERYQKTPVAKDPLALENDFRNATAWFSDLLPAGVGMPSWIMRMFVSPAMGIARFQETGDFRQVLWGFEDALGNMPLLNLDTVMNSWRLANELQSAAEAEAAIDNIESTQRASRLMLTAMGTLESMLFESAFASMLYQAADEWDRDPYAVVDRGEFGDIRRDKVHGTPLQSTALTGYIDPETGQERKAYVKHTDAEAQLRAMAENRPMLAWALSVIKQDSTYLRQNMVVKTRKVESEGLTQDEAIELIMSVVDNELGREVLTVDGAEAVVRGIRLGTVRLDSPALQGVFIPREMKNEIEKRVLSELVEKYIDLGFSKSEALTEAKIEYYGQAYGEPDGLGFADILWGQHIPEHPTQKYMQLNTTYVLGPNGRPIATGVQRSVATALFGFDPTTGFDTFHTGATSNLDVDQLLNSVDSTRGSNLGLRGLVKQDESWVPKSPEEIGEGIEKAIREIGEELSEKIDTLGRVPRGGRYSGFSGSGYSSYRGSGPITRYGGMPLRFNAQRRVRSPYADDLYNINTSSSIIRRATIKRERFASQRGRLNQWQ